MGDKSLEWRRIKKVEGKSKNLKLYDDITAEDVNQGKIGNCW